MEINDEAALISSAEMLHFCTINSDGFPSVRPMANLRNSTTNPQLVEFFKEIDAKENKFTTYLTTYGCSQKVKDLKGNEKCSLFFINMKTGDSLSVYGSVEFIDDEALKERMWNDAWKRSYPQGVKDPNYTIMKFIPVKVRSSHHGKSNEHNV